MKDLRNNRSKGGFTKLLEVLVEHSSENGFSTFHFIPCKQ